MNPVSRGIRNAFRNGVRTASIVTILGLSIGLALTMLVAQRAVENKITSVKSSIGNTVTISPAGFTPGSEANNALTAAELAKVRNIAHITGLTETLSDRLATTGSSTPSFKLDSTASQSTTSLTSPITLNMDSPGGGGRLFVSGGMGGSFSPANFSLPISFIGTNNPTQVDGVDIALQSGKDINGSSTSNNALISTQMASKNNLSVGSTFSAYNTTLTVAGIFTTTNKSTENTVILPLIALQNLSGQSDTVTSAVATVDSLDNLTSTTSAIQKTLGSSADVESAEQQASNTVSPLNSVKSVAAFTLIGAVVVGAGIILLTMVMVVRERRKEIGVAKAIGGSNLRIMSEFMVESLTLAILGAGIGLLIGVIGGQPVTRTLVTNSTNTSASTAPFQGGRAMPDTVRVAGGGGFTEGFRQNGAVRGLDNINAQIGWGILLDGFGAAILIAVIGSALSAGMIAKVRPSTIMRAE